MEASDDEFVPSQDIHEPHGSSRHVKQPRKAAVVARRSTTRQLTNGGALDSQTTDSQHIRGLLAEASAPGGTEGLDHSTSLAEDDLVLCGRDIPDESGITNCCDCCAELKAAYQNLKIIREINRYQLEDIIRLQDIVDARNLDRDQESQFVREPSPAALWLESRRGASGHGEEDEAGVVKTERGKKRPRRDSGIL